MNKIFFIIIIVILFLYFIIRNTNNYESFSINENYDRLYNHKKKYYLFARNKSLMSGVNPLIFDSYVDYIRWANMNYNKQQGNEKNFRLLKAKKIKNNPFDEYKAKKPKFDKMNAMSNDFKGGNYAMETIAKDKRENNNNNNKKNYDKISKQDKKELRKKINNSKEISIKNVNELGYIDNLVEGEDEGEDDNSSIDSNKFNKKKNTSIEKYENNNSNKYENNYVENNDSLNDVYSEDDGVNINNNNYTQKEIAVSNNNQKIQKNVPISNQENTYEYPVEANIKNQRKIYKSNGITTANKYKYNHREPNPKVLNNWGWSYMPPQVWSVPQDRPPVCIPQKNCPVCPSMNDKYADALKWDSVGSIMPKFEYKEIYNPDYYYPGWFSRDRVRYVPENYGDVAPIISGRGKYVT